MPSATLGKGGAVSGAIASRLRLAGARHGANLAQMMTAVVALYLHRFTRAQNLAFAITTTPAGQNSVNAPIAPAGKALPLQLTADPQVRFSSFVEQIVGAWLDSATTHQGVNVPTLHSDPATAHNGGAWISIHSIPYTAGSYFAGSSKPNQALVLGPVEDLTLHFRENEDGADIAIQLEANSDHYSPDELDWHSQRLISLLGRLDDDLSDRPLNRFAILDAKERTMIEQFNATDRSVAPGFLHALFESQAARTPDAVAVAFGNDSLSFDELNTQANRLAHYLIGLGAGPGQRVGIAMDQSPEMVVALLATLKSGAAYLPLDPRHPEARIAQMIRDADPVDVLTTTSLRNRLPASFDPLNLDSFETLDLLESQPTRNPTDADRGSPLQPQHPAYIIYTSGSTGNPKGVIVRHRELNHYLDWAGKLYQTGQGDGAPINTPIAFDATVTSLFLPLIAGRPIILLPEQGQIEALAELLASGRELTLVKLTPAHLEALRGLLGPRAANVRARVFVVGGEALPGHLAAFWQQQVTGLRIFNEYGPTETVVGCCVYELKSGDNFSGDVPIGSPTPNTRLYILDDTLQPMPLGAVGELFIGGAQVGAGYLGRPDLTAERFIADPYASLQNSVMYRTGDLARWRADGTLEFLGRADHQIKIRGFRIEPGEIEAALVTQKDIAQAVVVARDNGALGRQLVAYIVPKPGATVVVSTLRQHLAERLPDYMMPAAYVALDSLPLTTNGKLNRHALPAPSQLMGSDNHETSIIPRNATESALAAIWKRTFGRQTIGVRDNFFELGGHSLLAVQLISEVNRTLNVKLSVLELFQYPTIEDLSRVLTSADHKLRQPKLIQLQRGKGPSALFFIYQEGGVNEFQLARQLNSERPVFATVVPVSQSVLDAAARNKTSQYPSMETLASAHVALIQKHNPSGTCFLAGHSFNGLLAFEIARQLHQLGRKVEAIFLLDSGLGQKPFAWWLRNRVPFHFRNVRENGIGYLLNKAKFKLAFQNGKSAGTPDLTPPAVAMAASEVDSAVITTWKTLERIYHHATRRFRPQILDSRAVLFRVHETLSGIYFNDRSLGWSGQFKQGLEIIEVPGDHFSMLEKPHVEKLAKELSAALKRIDGSGQKTRSASNGLIHQVTLLASLKLIDWGELLECSEWLQVF